MFDLEKAYSIMVTKFGTFMSGTWVTLQLAFYTVLSGFVIGLIVTILRKLNYMPVKNYSHTGLRRAGNVGIGLIRFLMNAYVEFIRGTPLLVQVLVVVYGLPQLHLNYIGAYKMTKFDLCIIALAINSGAYMSELIRAGLESVDRGQTEAAECLGMTGWQRMLNIILPQAVKTILPTMGNEFVAIIKESSVLYTVGVYELTYQANTMASTNLRYLETMIDAALIYFVLTFVATRLLKLLERRMARADNR